MNTNLNHFIPRDLDTPEFSEDIVILQFVRIGNRQISVIEKNNKILNRIQSGSIQLYPFKEWRLTKSGNIQFSTIGQPVSSATTRTRANPMNPAAIYHIHGYRDIRSAQANDLGEY